MRCASSSVVPTETVTSLLLGHHFANRKVETCFESKITIGQNADQSAVFGDRHAGDLVMRHQLYGVFDLLVRRHGDRIHDHAAFRSLHLVDFRRLLLDRHVLVNDADAALLRERNGQARFGDGIHRGAHDRDVQFDAIGQRGSGANFGGQDVRFQREQSGHRRKCTRRLKSSYRSNIHPMTLFEFFAAAARTRIVSSNLGAFALHLSRRSVATVAALLRSL